jgi:hypothetical protein
MDSFGVTFTPKVNRTDREFKTIYGGIITFLIYLLAAMYFTYLIVVWQTKQIPPSVTQQTRYAPEGQFLRFPSRLFTLSIENDAATDELHELAETGRYYTVEGTYYGKNNVIKPLVPNKANYSCGIDKVEFDFYDPTCLNPNVEGYR